MSTATSRVVFYYDKVQLAPTVSVSSVESIPDLVNIQNPKEGDVALINTTPLSVTFYVDGSWQVQDFGGSGGTLQFDTKEDFPETGSTGIIYIDLSTKAGYYWEGSAYNTIQQVLSGTQVVSIAASKSVGKYTTGQTINLDGKTIQQFIADISTETQYPIITGQVFGINYSFTSSGINHNLQIIGTSIQVWIIFNYSTGQILGDLVGGAWNPAAVQANNGGNANAYAYVLGASSGSGGASTIQLTYTVIQVNNITGSISYGAGHQAKDSSGANYGTPIGAGNHPLAINFEGVYPIFATTIGITTSTQQTLYSMLTGNYIPLSLIGESGGHKQYFSLPALWLTARPLAQIQYFNTVSNSFYPIDKSSEFTVSDIAIMVAGQSVAYKRYTYNGVTRGALKIQLIF